MRKDEFPIVDKLVKDSINEVLDKIRAEIKQYNRQSNHYPVDMISISTVLQIIDKYRNEVSE